MNLQELETKAAEQFEAANRILQKYPNSEVKWSDEDRTAFLEHNRLAGEMNKEVIELRKHQSAIADVKRGHDMYYGNRQEVKETGSKENMDAKFREVHAKAFSAVLRGKPQEAARIIHESDVPDSYFSQLVDIEGKPLSRHALMVAPESAGGFTAPVDFVAEVQKDLAATTSIPGKCRQIPTNRNLVQLPAFQSHATYPKQYSSKFAGSWVNEEDRTVTAQSKQGGADFFEIINIPVGLYEPPIVPITESLFEDTAVNIDSEVAMALGEASGQDLENAVLNGDGLKKSPYGILTALAGVSGFYEVSGDADEITYDLFTKLNGSLANQYHVGAEFVMNQAVLAKVHRLKGSTNDHPLVQAFTNQNTIFGKPITVSNWMPDEGSNTYPVLLANFKHYGLAQMNSFSIRVYDQTTPGMKLVYSRWRVGGGIIRKQGFRLGKCSL